MKLALYLGCFVLLIGCTATKENAQDEVEQQRATMEDLRTQNLILEDENQSLNQINQKLKAKNQDLGKQLEHALLLTRAHVNSYPPPNNKNQPLVNGAVVRFDKGTNMVQINRGANHGVRLGHKFDLLRGEDYICSVMIDYVDGQTSVGHISVPGTSGKKPQAGDKATTLSGM